MKKLLQFNKLALFAVIFLNISALQGQNISGTIVDMNNNPLSYSHVVLYQDTTLISVTISNDDGDFAFKNLRKADYVLCVSYIGYKDTCLVIYNDQATQNLIIKLENSDTELDEIVIKGNRPEITLKDNKMVMTVNNSVLQELDQIQEVLKFIPGVITTDKGIEVFGKGKPLYLINDREVLTFQEVQSLSPSDIVQIEISYGSSKFEASVQCIINIKTKKKSNNTGVRLYTRAELVEDRFRSISTFRFNHSKNKQHHYLYYYNFYGKTLFKEGADMNIYLPFDNNYESSFDATALTNDAYNYLLYKFEYDLKPNQSIGIQWKGSLDTPDKNIDVNSIINKENHYFTKQNDYKEDIDFQTTLFYNLETKNKAKLSVLLDYYQLNIKQNVDITGISDYRIENRSGYNIYAAKADYSFPIAFAGAKLNIGSKYYQTINTIDNSLFEADNSELVNNNFTTQNKLTENSLAFYTSLQKSFADKINIEAGVRYENYVRDIEMITDDTLISRKNNYFFPSLTVSYLPLKFLQIMVGYSKHINRQAYDYISGQNIYVNPYLYKTGNPKLRPEIFNSYTANLVLFGGAIAMQAAYIDRKDYMSNEFFATDSVLRVGYANYKKQEWNFGLNLGSNIGSGRVSIGININKPNFEYKYLGEIVSQNRFNYNFNANLKFDFLKTFSVINSFQYNHKNSHDMLLFEPHLRNQLILAKTFWEKRFRIAFAYTYNSRQEFSSQFQELNMTNYIENDRNEFSLSLRYDFNYKRQKTKASSIDEELNRIQ